MGSTPSMHRPEPKISARRSACALLLVTLVSVAACWVPPGRLARSAIPYGSAQEQLAAVASSLRRERAVLEQKKQQLQRTAAVLKQKKEEIEEDLTQQVLELKKSKSNAEETLRREREELRKEKLRLAKESEVLAAKQQQLVEAARIGSPSPTKQHDELVAAINREKVALRKEREQLKKQAEAIQAARQQLARSMDRGQELEDLRTKAEALEAEADALRRERSALETQRRRIRAEAEDIAEEREILQEEAKKIHKAVSKEAKEAKEADPDLLESLRAAEKQLAQQTAEFRNFKWRVESESKSIEQRALAKAAKPLLLVLDDLQRAQMAGAAKGLSQEDLSQVLRPLRRRLVGVLEEFHVRPMPNAVGQAFDPQLHEAISVREDEVGEDVVVEQLEEGFLFGEDEVLRPAKVIVSS